MFFFRFWSHLGSPKMVLFILITPTYSTNMEVSFFAGISGKKKEGVEPGTVESDL